MAIGVTFALLAFLRNSPLVERPALAALARVSRALGQLDPPPETNDAGELNAYVTRAARAYDVRIIVAGPDERVLADSDPAGDLAIKLDALSEAQGLGDTAFGLRFGRDRDASGRVWQYSVRVLSDERVLAIYLPGVYFSQVERKLELGNELAAHLSQALGERYRLNARVYGTEEAMAADASRIALALCESPFVATKLQQLLPVSVAAVGASVDTRLMILAGGPGLAKSQTFKDAVEAARAAYLADPAVVAAQAVKKAALVDARTAYKAAMKSAKDAFFLATGHNPCRIRVAIPRV